MDRVSELRVLGPETISFSRRTDILADMLRLESGWSLVGVGRVAIRELWFVELDLESSGDSEYVVTGCSELELLFVVVRVICCGLTFVHVIRAW